MTLILNWRDTANNFARFLEHFRWLYNIFIFLADVVPNKNKARKIILSNICTICYYVAVLIAALHVLLVRLYVCALLTWKQETVAIYTKIVVNVSKTGQFTVQKVKDQNLWTWKILQLNGACLTVGLGALGGSSTDCKPGLNIRPLVGRPYICRLCLHLYAVVLTGCNTGLVRSFIRPPVSYGLLASKKKAQLSLGKTRYTLYTFPL